MVGMKSGQRAAMTDTDQHAFGQLLAEQRIERVFGALVDRRRRLVEKDQLWSVHHDAYETEALLLTRRQNMQPIGFILDSILQMTQLDRPQYLAHLLITCRARRLRIGQRAAQAPQGHIRLLG